MERMKLHSERNAVLLASQELAAGAQPVEQPVSSPSVVMEGSSAPTTPTTGPTSNSPPTSPLDGNPTTRAAGYERLPSPLLPSSGPSIQVPDMRPFVEWTNIPEEAKGPLLVSYASLRYLCSLIYVCSELYIYRPDPTMGGTRANR
jgi:hypothetical protein